MIHIDLPGGEAARIIEANGEHAVVRSSTPSPPGSTLRGVARDGSGEYRVKVRGCRRIADDDALPFRIEGRFVDLTKQQRARLLSGSGQ